MRDLPLLLSLYCLLIAALLSAHAQEGVVIATVVPQPFSVAKDCVRSALIQEGPIVRDNDNCLFPILQELLEPRHCMHIEVVCRFIKQQQIWLYKQRLSQGNAHSPPTAELLRGPQLVLAAEAQAGEDHGSARLGVLTAKFLKPLVNLHETNAVDLWLLAGAIVFASQQLLLDFQEPLPLQVRLEHALEHWGFVPLYLLLHVHDHNVCRNGNAPVALCHCAQECALANAVATNEAILVAVSQP
mmetsp:Transcript_79605/g.184793  ORF Transcript_79605/g.184793 Transcript_79605/m.184793 type:complete len:243 (-) Transcript_79605:159-887(-)